MRNHRTFFKRFILLVASCSLTVLMLGAQVVIAAPAAPAFTVESNSAPTVFSAEHDGSTTPDVILLTVTNSGSLATGGGSIKIVDTLPAALNATHVEGVVQSSRVPLSCTSPSVAVSCTFAGVLLPGEDLSMRIAVIVTTGARGIATNTARVEGNGVPSAVTSAPVRLGSTTESATEPFGLESFSFHVTGVDGSTDTQAGDHPYEQTTSFSLNSLTDTANGSYPTAGGIAGTEGAAKEFIVDLPAGFLGDPQAIERCPQYRVPNGECSTQSQIGFSRLLTSGLTSPSHVKFAEVVPIYNVIPDKGYPAQFEFTFGGSSNRGLPVSLYATVNPETNYGVRVTVPDIPAAGKVTASAVMFFGTPSTDADYENHNSGSSSTGIGTAFLENPTGCTDEPQSASISVDSWQHPGAQLSDGAPNLTGGGWATARTTVYPQLSGCELLQFSPALEITPETSQADQPTGVAVNLSLPQAPPLVPDLDTPALKGATITLPPGMSISPSAANGLEGCSDAQFEVSSPEPGTCPSASVLGSAIVTTPLLGEPLKGKVFLGIPECDPCSDADASDGRMFRLFLEVAGAGVVIKKEGMSYANPDTGQLTTTFSDLPPEPVDHIELQLKGGPRADLASPQECGPSLTTSDLTPWSTPITPDGTPSSEFDVSWDGQGQTCPGSFPFSPSVEAGTSNPSAGQFSPLIVTFKREDREQDVASIQVATPPGLLGSLVGVSLCEEPQADLGTCSSASRIGRVTVAAGPGEHPFYEEGVVYLTGPYKNAPFGLSVVVPTIAGPFNLGNVVVRAQVNIDPHTAALTVTTNPLPQILDGIPLRLRLASVTIDRSDFIFNPTNCSQQAIAITITGAKGAQAHNSIPFAVSDCGGLHFDPKFKVSTSGKTSRADGASLDAKVTIPSGPESNIAQVKVSLPKQLPARLTTLQKACLAKIFEVNPAECSGSSLVGAARVTTPVLPVPLTGPAYFVSNGSAKFPELVIVLQGYGVRVDLRGETFISKLGGTSSTFSDIPDVPFSTFELYLPEGLHSALTANVHLCQAKKLDLPTQFVAQDGERLNEITPLTITGCAKVKAAKKTRTTRKIMKATATFDAGSNR